MPVPPPSTVEAAVSPELDAIVLQALERDREHRYTRAAHMARDLDVYLQAHRFAVEDMAEYMKTVWPADAREEVPDGAMTSSYSIQRITEPTAPSSPRAIAGTPSAIKAERVKAEGDAAAGRRRAIMYGGAALLAIGVAAIVVVPMARRGAAAKDEPHTVVEPIVRPAEADKPLGNDKPIDRPLDQPLRAPAEGDVRVVSDPSGAQVYAGPKLLGTAPVTLHLTKGGSEAVTLVHSGYEDLNYTVQSGDGPALTLRMLRHHHAEVVTHKSAPPPPSVKDKGPHKTKVDTFDDGEKPPHVPKVQAIDD